VSGYADEPAREKRPKDPLLRFLGGCAIVAAVLLTLCVSLVFLAGWQLTRDPAPGRPSEVFLLGDETRYWRFDLRADDDGMRALFARFAQINDERRKALLSGTILENLPLPSRKAQLEELAPLTFEIAFVLPGPPGAASLPSAWTARGTFSRGMFKMRALVKLMGWIAKPKPGEVGPLDVDGIPVTRIGNGFALATVGNRVIVASDAPRMGEVLRSARGTAHPPDAALSALHEAIKLDGEDVWAFVSDVGGGAAASFDVNANDELAFRIRVAAGAPFDGSADARLAIARAFLPRIPADVIELGESDGKTFSGKIEGLSRRFASVLTQRTRAGSKEPLPPPGGPETPSATPTPPSPPRPSGRRSDTPAAPTHGESPRPPR
jgi:hypothetical protein